MSCLKKGSFYETEQEAMESPENQAAEAIGSFLAAVAKEPKKGGNTFRHDGAWVFRAPRPGDVICSLRDIAKVADVSSVDVTLALRRLVALSMLYRDGKGRYCAL
jgi:hypothetical protein